MRSIKLLSVLFFALCLFSCETARKSTTVGDDGILEFQILQMNDVYEISPSASDNIGGLARVATIRKEMLAKNPLTFTVLSGDFISPSVIGTLKYEGKRIRGKHMVEVLNTLGLDWVVFGNHEFDYDDLSDLQSRLDESKFSWFGANARLKLPMSNEKSQPFYKTVLGGAKEPCPDNRVLTLQDKDGTLLKVGIFGVLINSGKKPWVEYLDWAETARKNFTELKPQSDVVLAITHLAIEDDKKLAAMLPEIPLVMGGHEHDNMRVPVGPSVVTKADANAKTVYIHTIRYDKRKKKCSVSSELKKVNSSIADEPATAAVIEKWEKIKNESLSSSGFNATAVVTKLEKPLDCRETIIRHGQAPVGTMITEAMLAVSRTKPECAVLNSGSIRVDDVLSGTLTELDIVRMLPFGGGITEVKMKGGLLRKTLETGLTNKGNGGFLQLSKARFDQATGKWFIGANSLDDNKLYRVALPDFLLSGNESNMGFLKASVGADGKSDNLEIPEIVKPDPKDKSDLRNDVRLALIKHLRGE
ncbi:MAG: bifunctional metallophosphatase/5'-nucleotidase [Saprospiraceae bacterium]